MKTNIEKFDTYKDGNERRLFWREGPGFTGSKDSLVFICHDGHSLFEREDPNDTNPKKSSFKMHEVLADLGVTDYLVAGLESNGSGYVRVREYSPVELRPDLIEQIDDVEPNTYFGKKYIDALFNNLIPYLEKEHSFKFSEVKKIMLGASMGGVITTYVAKAYPNKFDAYLAFSCAFNANTPYIFDFIEKDDVIGTYYHDIGGKEKSRVISTSEEYVGTYERMKKYLAGREHSLSVFQADGEHNPYWWNMRLPKALKWALKEIED